MHQRERLADQFSARRVERSLQRIAIVRALPGLGDFLCAIPTLRALRQAHPQAKMTLIGLPNLRALADRFHAYVDEFVELPGYPGLPEQAVDRAQLIHFLQEMRSREFDLAIQMHGSGVITNSLTAELGATQSAGFFLPGQPCPDSQTFLTYIESESEVRRYLRLMEHLGVPSEGEHLEFPIKRRDRQELDVMLNLYGLEPGAYICIHAGASVASRCWGSDRFAAVGEMCARMGWQVVLTGSASERALADTIVQKMLVPSTNLAGQTSLGVLAALLQSSRLLICNDTGVSHLADALQVPSVVIFSASDPKRWAPLDQQLHRSILPPASVGTVLHHVQDLLEREHAYVA